MASNSNQSSNNSKKSQFNPFENMAQWPQMDAGEMKKQWSRQMEAATAASQVAVDCTRAAAKTVADMVQKNAQCAYECSRESLSSRNVEDVQSRSADMLTYTVENFFNCAREVSEIHSRAAKEMLDIYNRNVAECMADVRKKAA